MWHWLLSLDQPTRAAIIGGVATVLSVFGALLGVYLNLAWNRKQHRDEKSYNLRRDVYLDAIALINRSVGFLSRKALPEQEKAESDAKADLETELVGSCVKVHLLGSKRVAAAGIAFQSSFQDWSSKFSVHRMLYEQSGQRQQEIIKALERFAETLKAFTAHRSQAGQVIKEFDLGDSDSEERKKALEATSEYKQFQATLTDTQKHLEQAKVALIKTATERYQELARSLDYYFQVQADLEPFLHEVILAMKADLGIRTDERWYKDKMQIAAERSLRAMKEQAENHPVIKQLRAKLKGAAPENENEA
jgi:hypothetical protein